MKQNINKQTKNKPKKGIQLDGATGEVTSTAAETEVADDSFK